MAHAQLTRRPSAQPTPHSHPPTQRCTSPCHPRSRAPVGSSRLGGLGSRWRPPRRRCSRSQPRPLPSPRRQQGQLASRARRPGRTTSRALGRWLICLRDLISWLRIAVSDSRMLANPSGPAGLNFVLSAKEQSRADLTTPPHPITHNFQLVLFQMMARSCLGSPSAAPSALVLCPPLSSFSRSPLVQTSPGLTPSARPPRQP